MKKFQKELLSISKSISRLAVKIETLAKRINGEQTKTNPAESSLPAETIVKKAT